MSHKRSAWAHFEINGDMDDYHVIDNGCDNNPREQQKCCIFGSLFSSSKQNSSATTNKTTVNTTTGSEGSIVAAGGGTINFADKDVLNNVVNAHTGLLESVSDNLFSFTDKTLGDVLGKNQQAISDAVTNLTQPDTESIKSIIKTLSIAAVVGVGVFAWAQSR